MATEEITDAVSHFKTLLDLLAEGQDDKHIARKLGCSQGEVKRRRASFARKGILKEDGKGDKGRLNAWLESKEGQSATRQWETHHQAKQQRENTPGFQQKGFHQPDIKRTWLRQKRG